MVFSPASSHLIRGSFRFVEGITNNEIPAIYYQAINRRNKSLHKKRSDTQQKLQ
jgi:hypothetical protein